MLGRREFLGFVAAALPVIEMARRNPKKPKSNTSPAPTPSEAPSPSPTPTVTATATPSGGLASGWNFHGFWGSYTSDTRTVILDRAAEAGIGHVRIDTGWITFQPNGPGSLDPWARGIIDECVTKCEARGIRPLLILQYTPHWANGGRGKLCAPTNPDDFRAYCKLLAAHYAGRCDYEVWNEPDSSSFFAPNPAVAGSRAQQYAAMVRAAYAGVKAADPTALVAAGATVGTNIPFLTDVYAAGITADAMSCHPYPMPANAAPGGGDMALYDSYYNLGNVHRLHDLMAANRDGDKPIWLTEYGYSTHANSGSEPPWRLGVSEDQQAAHLITALRWIKSNLPYVTRFYWYTDKDQTNSNTHTNNYGVLRLNLSPKPVHAAWKSYNGR
jgi:hypothetical protein